MAALNILGEKRTFDQISRGLSKNQTFVDEWVERQGTRLAGRAHFHGKYPLEAYFTPRPIPDPKALKKKLIGTLDKEIGRLTLRGERKYFKEAILPWIKNPALATEKAIYDMAQELNTKWHQWVDLEFLFRRERLSLRKNLTCLLYTSPSPRD